MNNQKKKLSSYEKLKQEIRKAGKPLKPVYEDVRDSGKQILGDIKDIQKPAERIAQQTTDVFRPAKLQPKQNVMRQRRFNPLGMSFRQPRKMRKVVVRYVNIDDTVYAELNTGEYVPAQTF